MRIKPLTGQVLVELLEPERFTTGGIEIPDRTASADETQTKHRTPEDLKIPAQTAYVRAIGPWPKLKNGMALLPEFGIGAKVAINPYRGQEMQRHLGERYKMIESSDVLAVLK